MPAKKYFIVNADDFGQSPGINRGIIEAHERGIVSSASLMVRWPAVAEAAAYGRQHPELSLGLHFDLGEWAFRDGTWVRLYQVAPEGNAALVEAEVSRQLAAFRQFVGREPTHIDSHQHVHLREPVRSIVLATARKLRVPVRNCSVEIRYCGRFYGQTAEGSPYAEGISLQRLLEILAELPPGWTELSCHPGHGTDLDTMYRAEREQEARALCDPRVREAIVKMGIELCSFGSIGVRSLPVSAVPGGGTAAGALRDL
jgi:chitin disaccharide deacetylase